MKKALISVVALAALAACGGTYDYYRGDVKYIQDGADCIYYAGEQGREFSNEISDIDTGKKIVYRNTRCADMFKRDNFGTLPRPERKVLTQAAPECGCAQKAESTCGCKACNGGVVTRRYVIVPAM